MDDMEARVWPVTLISMTVDIQQKGLDSQAPSKVDSVERDNQRRVHSGTTLATLMASQAQLCRMTPPSEGGSRYAAEPLYYQLCELRHATSTFHSFDPDDGYISNRSLQGYKPDAQSAVAWAERSDGVTPINAFMHAIQNIVVDA